MSAAAIPYKFQVLILQDQMKERTKPLERGSPLRRLVELWYDLMGRDLAWRQDLPRMRQEAATTPREHTREYLRGEVAALERKFSDLQEQLKTVREELTEALPQFRW
jgi:hypothetical protein